MELNCYSAATGLRLNVHPFNTSRRNTMAKAQKSNKETKKQPLHTPKEKKAAKQAKKHAGDVVPMVVKGS